MVSSLAAAAAKMTLTPSPKTPQKDDTGRVQQSKLKHEKKAQPYKKNHKKETEVSGGTELGPRSSLAQYNNERQRTPAKNGDTDKKNRNNNGSSRKKNTANKPKGPSTTEPVKFEFYLNSSDDDSPGPRHKDKNRQGRDKDWISNGGKSYHQKHDKSHHRGNNSDHRQHHDAHNSHQNTGRRKNNASKQERGGRFKNSNENNGRVIDVNVSRRLIGHALGKRIPVNEQRTNNKYDDGPRKNQNQSQQKKSSLAQHKSTSSSQYSNNKKTVKKIETKSPLRREPESEQEEGPKLIPSSQLNGPIEKCEMKRWADDDDNDDY
eukprot:148463_1